MRNPGLAVLLTIGVLLVAYVSRKASKTHFNNFRIRPRRCFLLSFGA